MEVSAYAMPHGPHERRHGPSGYADYTAYKQWLRDEFQFRCVFCLHRETWGKDGWRDFEIDHIKAQACGGTDLYENLQYVCGQCNSHKKIVLLPDPCTTAYHELYVFESSGKAKGLTMLGKKCVEKLQLNKPDLVRFRKKILRLLERLKKAHEGAGEDSDADELKEWFGYPADIPNLRTSRPPANSKPDGKEKCYHALLENDAIPILY